MKRLLLIIFKIISWIFIFVGIIVLLLSITPIHNVETTIAGTVGSLIIGVVFLICGIGLNKSSKKELNKLKCSDGESIDEELGKSKETPNSTKQDL